jgi:hypothetical protein
MPVFITFSISGSEAGLGPSLIVPGSPFSTAKAIAGKPSVARFSHNICVGTSGDGYPMMTAIITTNTSAILVDRRKKQNFVILMLSFKEYLIEAAQEGKNLHLEHLEDEVLNHGVDGTRAAINFLQSLRDMLAGNAKKSVNVSVKWDGAPAIFAGINPENDKFFVGTKGVFNVNPKVNYTDADIDKNHSAAGLNAKLKVALKYLPKLGITDVLQGDMLFTDNDLKQETIDDKSYITFTPNTITYAIPKESSHKITKAKMGIVWHTTYSGEKLERCPHVFKFLS